MHKHWQIKALVAAALSVGLSACGGLELTGRDAVLAAETQSERQEAGSHAKRFGDAGIRLTPLLFGDSASNEAGGGTGVAVNTYLWRASLDTLSFLPLSTADPFGGVIISDWYTPPESEAERFKVTVFILDRQLRSDGVRASVFRQRLDDERGWVDAEVTDDTAYQLENAILSRARELRVSLGDTG